MYCLVIEQRLLPNTTREVSSLITWPTWSWLTIGRSTIASTLILIVVSNMDSLRGDLRLDTSAVKAVYEISMEDPWDLNRWLNEAFGGGQWKGWLFSPRLAELWTEPSLLETITVVIMCDLWQLFLMFSVRTTPSHNMALCKKVSKHKGSKHNLITLKLIFAV